MRPEPLSQWRDSLCCYWLKRLRQRQVALVIRTPCLSCVVWRARLVDDNLAPDVARSSPGMMTRDDVMTWETLSVSPTLRVVMGIRHKTVIWKFDVFLVVNMNRLLNVPLICSMGISREVIALGIVTVVLSFFLFHIMSFVLISCIPLCMWASLTFINMYFILRGFCYQTMSSL